MGYTFNDETPIYLQIIEHIKMKIMNKTYMPRQKLPSVRELSIELEVNPNTVQKALFELENIGLIYTERTNGKFVTTDQALILSSKKREAEKLAREFYEKMSRF